MKFEILFQKTALHIAVENEKLEIIGLLVKDKRIDVNITNEIFLLHVSIRFNSFYKMVLLCIISERDL